MSSPPVPAGARALVPKRGGGGGGGGPSSIRTATLVVSGRARRSGSSAAAMADSPGGGAPAEKGEKDGGSGGERDKCSVPYMCVKYVKYIEFYVRRRICNYAVSCFFSIVQVLNSAARSFSSKCAKKCQNART